MAVVTQKLLFIFILVNIICGGALTMYQEKNTEDTILANIENKYYQSLEDSDRLKTEDNVYGNARTQVSTDQNPSILSAILAGLSVLKFMWNVVNPLSVLDFDTFRNEGIVAEILVVFISTARIMMWILVLIEAYMLFINRKQS